VRGTVVTKENPRRAGTVQHERYGVIMRSAGFTVADFIAKGGDRKALTYAVAGGHAKLSGGRT
jgi:hypothetical protein